MLVFFCIIVFIFTINSVLFFSSIRIEIEKLKIDITQKPVINDYRVNIYIAFLNKVKYVKLSVYKEKMDKMNNLNFNKIKERITKLRVFKKLNEKGVIKSTTIFSKALKNTHIMLEKINIKADVGIDNIVILSYLVAIIDIIICILLSRRTFSNYNETIDNYNYTILPHQTKNCYLKTYISAKFSIKISNIIKNILYYNRFKSIIIK